MKLEKQQKEKHFKQTIELRKPRKKPTIVKSFTLPNLSEDEDSLLNIDKTPSKTTDNLQEEIFTIEQD